MEKLINTYDKEYMKMAMLKHEEIFREQVYELHRLYQTQKLLMKNMSQQARHDQYQHYPYVDKRDIRNATNVLNGQYFDSNKKIKTPRQYFDLEVRPDDKGCNVNAESGVEDIEDETELELTLGLSSYNVGRRRKTASHSASSSTGSTGQIKHITNLASTGHKWGLENLPVSNPSFQLIGGRQNNPNLEEQFRSQDSSMNNPPWLFQVLSLNMT